MRTGPHVVLGFQHPINNLVGAVRVGADDLKMMLVTLSAVLKKRTELSLGPMNCGGRGRGRLWSRFGWNRA